MLKCSNEPGMSCSCKLFAVHLLFDVITEQINDDDDDDDGEVMAKIKVACFFSGTRCKYVLI